jgi:uncharacterized membrane protein YqjE
MDEAARTAGGGLGDYAYGRSADRATSDVVRDIIGNVEEMVRSEARLARAEFREETAKSLAAARKMGIAAGAGLFAVAFFLVSVSLLLSFIVPLWAAFLIVGSALGIAAAILFVKAKDALRVPKPEKTIESMKETVEWMKNQTRS